MLTRKHFKRIAKILMDHKAKNEVVLAFIEWCKMENPNFNTSKFIEACGGVNND